jgi:uncharacterized membrane protein
MNRERLRLLGILVGAIVTVYAAVRGEWLPAVVFGVATVAVGAGVLYQRRT